VHVYLVSIQGSLFIPFGLQGLALSPGLTGKALPPLHLPLTPPAMITQPLIYVDSKQTGAPQTCMKSPAAAIGK